MAGNVSAKYGGIATLSEYVNAAASIYFSSGILSGNMPINLSINKVSIIRSFQRKIPQSDFKSMTT
jgi:hypothetical protein